MKNNGKVRDVKTGLQSLEIEGTHYMTKFNKKFPPKMWVRPDEKEVLAFIPGTIQKIMVKPGQTVNAGDSMIILEAMKMRNHVKSGINGVVKNIHVAEGDMVPKNYLIIEFE